MYNTHSPLSLSVEATPDLFYREEIQNAQLYSDDHWELEATG